MNWKPNVDSLPELNVKAGSGPMRRGRGIRRPSSQDSTDSAEELAQAFKDSQRRTSNVSGLRLGSIREAGDADKISSFVLERTKRGSIVHGKLDASKAADNLASYFNSIPTDDILAESIKCIKNRIGQGVQEFESRDLYSYLSEVFKKSRFEMNDISEAVHGAEHSLQIQLGKVTLNKSAKTVFCSVSLKKKNEPFNFTMCTEENTKLSKPCSGQNYVWNSPLESIALQNSKGWQLLVGIWESSKSKPSISTLEKDGKLKGAVEIELNDHVTGGTQHIFPLTKGKAVLKGKTGNGKGDISMSINYNSIINQHSKAVMVRAGMLNRFLCHDIPTEGRLRPVALHILHLQETQQKLTVGELRYVDWLVQGERYLRTNSNYEKLAGTLSRLIQSLAEPTHALAEEDVRIVWRSFRDFTAAYVDRMAKMNVLYPYTSEMALIELKFFTTCYTNIMACPGFHEDEKRINSQVKLQMSMKRNVEVSLANITDGISAGEDADAITQIISACKFVKHIYVELKQAESKYIPHLVLTPYASTLLSQINEMVEQKLYKILAEVVPHIPEEDDFKVLDHCLQLYMIVADLKKECEAISSADNHYLNTFHPRFSYVINKWLDAKQRLHREYIKKSVVEDNLKPVNQSKKWSKPVFDVECMNVQQLAEMLARFDFPNTYSRFNTTAKMNKVISENYLTLSEQLYDRGKQLLEGRKAKLVDENEDITPHLVLASSLHHILNRLENLPRLLEFYHFSEINEQMKKLQDKIEKVEAEVRNSKNVWIVKVCEKVIQPSFVKAFYSFVEFCHQNREEDARNELCRVVDIYITKIQLNVEDELLYDFLRCLWDRVILPRFLDHIEAKPVKKHPYYSCVQKGLMDIVSEMGMRSEELRTNIENSREMERLNNYVKCLSETSDELLFTYFEGEIAAQEAKIEAKRTRGTVTFTANLTSREKNQILNVRVIRCNSLPKMDTIGSCDAIVKVTVQPQYTSLIPNARTDKTKTVKSLNPEFPDQVFSQPLNLDFLDLPKSLCLQLAVWDQDFRADDFVGECLLPLNEVLASPPGRIFTLPLVVPDLEDKLYTALKQRAVYTGPIKKFVKERSKLVTDAPRPARKSILLNLL